MAKRAVLAGSFLALSLFVRCLSAADAGTLPLRPGMIVPQPRQRGLNEIHALPVEEIACPACSYVVKVPQVDRLVRRPAGASGETPRWEMHAGSRDADLCPHPWTNKVSFQADIVTCPSCGHSRMNDRFADPVPKTVADWIRANLRPNLRGVQYRLLGRRGEEMNEAEAVAFFNNQQEIPDTVRTEHARVQAAAMEAPLLEQARFTWLAAWAVRRELCAPPKGDFLARRAARVAEAIEKSAGQNAGPAGELEALGRFLARKKTPPPFADLVAARLRRAGCEARLGFHAGAEKTLEDLLAEIRERFLRPEQDPLWTATSARAARNRRIGELDRIRSEAEREIGVRLGLAGSERELLRLAADLIRRAVMRGELDAGPDEAMFHAYLVGEFLRRDGNLPLAAEWFKNILALVPAPSPIHAAAAMQLEIVRGQAADRINLLSALGSDGEIFHKLRGIGEAAPEGHSDG